MTPRIHVLPPHLADQIAAGEVIERPASVVKELVENALDAGARRVEVEIEAGGLSLIRVLDDGCGMTPEEARLALQRHATSKLRAIDDLFSLTTMGFRGEALPSIAAVSRLTLTTRTAETVAAHRLTVEASQITGEREAGAPVGTQIEVRDLLFNVPARLKFIKGDATEVGHVTDALLRLGLAFPKVHLRLRVNGKVNLDLPPHGTELERAQAALSSRGRGQGALQLYRGEAVAGELRATAYLAAPEDSAGSPRLTYLYVNRRYVRDRSLLHSLALGFGEVLPKGRYPLGVLLIDMPGDAVDINVHPQKLEVRFRDAQGVYKAVRDAVRPLVAQAPWLLGPQRGKHTTVSAELFFGDAAGSGVTEVGEVGEIPEAAEAPEASDVRPDYGASEGVSEISEEEVRRAPVIAAPGPLVTPAGGAGLSEHRARLQQALGLAGVPGAPLPATPGGAPRRAFFSAMNFLGQYRKTYLLCEHEGELLLIDQHAAHESLSFQRLRRAYQSKGLAAQRLLFPLSLELDPQAAALCEEEPEVLGRLGFELRPFGGRTFALTTAPDTVEYGRGAKVHHDPERVLRKVIEDLLAHGSSEAIAAREERILATVACHSVVRAGDMLDEMKARALLASMDEEAFVPHCPHGRPVLIRFAPGEIERRFGRA